MSSLTPEAVGRGLAVLRIAAGVGAWLAPGLSTRTAFRVPANNPALPLVLRLFGTRDVALGAGYLTAEAHEKDRLLQLGMAVDAADAAAALLAGRSGRLEKRAAVPMFLSAVSAVGVAAWARSNRGG